MGELEWSMTMGISNKLPRDLDSADWETIL